MYGEERRSFTKINDFPQNLKSAVIAAEDQRFYQHWGRDVLGVARAIIGNITSGGVQSGASTITQQVAKNFYLSNERTFTRKFNEALLAYKRTIFEQRSNFRIVFQSKFIWPASLWPCGGRSDLLQ